MVYSAITWSGFDNFYYLFTYEDTRDAFSIPYDIEIIQEVFQPPAESETPASRIARHLYNRNNKFFEATSLADLVDAVEHEVEKAAFAAKISNVKKQYAALSDDYQKHKGSASAIAFK